MIDPVSLLRTMAAPGSAAAVPVVVMFALFTPKDQHQHDVDAVTEKHLRHVAEATRPFILDTVERARAEQDGPYKQSLCRTLEEAIAALCADAPNDAICEDREIHLSRAGCR